MIAYSSLPGYVSNRDHYRGTWFIESICKVGITATPHTDKVSMCLRRLSWNTLKTWISEIFWTKLPSFSKAMRVKREPNKVSATK